MVLAKINEMNPALSIAPVITRSPPVAESSKLIESSFKARNDNFNQTIYGPLYKSPHKPSVSLSAAAAAAAAFVGFFFPSHELTSWLLPGAVVTAESAACSLPADRRGGTDHNFQFSGVKAVSRTGGGGAPPSLRSSLRASRFLWSVCFLHRHTPNHQSVAGGGVGGGAHTSAAVGDIKFYSAGFIHSPGGGEREGEKKEGKEEAAGEKEEIQAPQGQTSHTGTLNTACASWCDCRVCILYMRACVCVCICLFQQEIRAQPGLSNLVEQVCEPVALPPPLPPLPQSLPAVQ